MPQSILIIEDDQRLAEMVKDYLTANAYEVDTAFDGTTGLKMQSNKTYDLAILDLMLPDIDGLEICRIIKLNSSLPIIMLTAKGDPMDRVVGLELGADDYMGKPFEPRELLARIRAVARRGTPMPSDNNILSFGRLTIEPDRMVVSLDGKECDLTSYQFNLLMALAQSSGRVLSRDQIMDQMKGQDFDAFDRSIDVHISRIRNQIEDDPKQPKRILTIRGAGYVFAKEQD